MTEEGEILFADSGSADSAEALCSFARDTVEGLACFSHRTLFSIPAYRGSEKNGGAAETPLRPGGYSRKGTEAGQPASARGPLHILLDGSRSMNFASEGRSKFDYAKRLAACFASRSLAAGENVRAKLLDGTGDKVWLELSRAEGLKEWLKSLSEWRADGKEGGTEAVLGWTKDVEPGGQVLWLGDFLEESEIWRGTLERLRFAGFEVLVLQVLDPAELNFPFEGPVEFGDIEGGESLVAEGERVRRAYLDELEKLFSKLREACSGTGGGYVRADSSKSPAEVFHSVLELKKRRQRLSWP